MSTLVTSSAYAVALYSNKIALRKHESLHLSNVHYRTYYVH